MKLKIGDKFTANFEVTKIPPDLNGLIYARPEGGTLVTAFYVLELDSIVKNIIHKPLIPQAGELWEPNDNNLSAGLSRIVWADEQTTVYETGRENNFRIIKTTQDFIHSHRGIYQPHKTSG